MFIVSFFLKVRQKCRLSCYQEPAELSVLKTVMCHVKT